MSSHAAEFLPLERQAALQDGYRRVFVVAGQELLLIAHDGAAHLLENICPHAGYPLHEGLVLDGALRCPMHGYLFELHSGACVFASEGPCRGLYRYPLVQQGDMTGVQLPLIPLQSGPFQGGKGT